MKVKQITGDILEKICNMKVIKIVEIANGLYTIKINIPNFELISVYKILS